MNIPSKPLPRDGQESRGAAAASDGAGVIVDYLIREKVPYVFGLCGHGNIGFIDALHARANEIKTWV